MDITALIAIVVALTQTVKSWIKSWFHIPDENWKGWFSVILSFFVSLGVVFYYAIKSGSGLSISTLLLAIAVWALANGGKKILNSLRK